MVKKLIGLVAASLLAGVVAVQSETPKSAYPVMPPLDQYMMPDAQAEIALARSAAVRSISGAAEVMVLGKDGYTTAVKGTNGFVCIVQRSWGALTTDPEFWNPKAVSPICYNAAAARSFLPIYLLKTKLVLAGKSKPEILQAMNAAFAGNELPSLEPAAMCYMLSKRQYINDSGKAWHPHLMFFVAGDAVKSWGANLPDSPVFALYDPEQRTTTMMVWAGKWSDGTAVPAAAPAHEH
jgi:hypothetical protein